MSVARAYLILLAVFLGFAFAESTPFAESAHGAESPTPATPDVAPSWQDVQVAEEGKLRVLYVPADGWAYKDEQGRLGGVTVELMRWFAEWLSQSHDVALSVDFVQEEDWSRFYQRVVQSQGGVFGIGNVTITEARREELSFSPAYLTNVAVLLSHSDQATLSSMADIDEVFDGLSGLAFQGTLHEDRMKAVRDGQMPDLDIEFVSSNDEIIRRASQGGYFAWIDVYNFWRAKEAGQPLRRHPVGDDAGEEFGVIMPRDSDWAPLMRRFFQETDLVESERWARLMEKHLGPKVSRLLLAQ